jgi:hypothetical protein
MKDINIVLTNKTTNMVRTVFGIQFEQSKVDGYINVTQVFNAQRELIENFQELREQKVGTLESKGSKKYKIGMVKRLDNYWESEAAKELQLYLAEVEDVELKKLKRLGGKGANRCTFVHPLLFVDIMAWLSVEFKVWAYKLIMDHLLENRKLSGQSNPELNAAFDVAGFITDKYQYGTINRAIGDACECAFEQSGYTRRYLWDTHASSEQLAYRNKVQTTIITMIEMDVIKSFKEGIIMIQRMAKRFQN